MNEIPKNLFKLIIFALFLCLVNISVFAGSDATSSTASDLQAFPAELLTGTLYSTDAATVSVNSNAAGDEMTVFSGAEIKTSARGATINLSGLGEVMLMPNTTGKLTFDAKSIKVSLTTGNALLTEYSGTEGTLITPEGKVLTTNSATMVSIIGNTIPTNGLPASAYLPSTPSWATSAVFGPGLIIIHSPPGGFNDFLRGHRRCRVSDVRPCRRGDGDEDGDDDRDGGGD